jgi:hypothetical protein
MEKYVYVDNSNVWIEGKRVAAVEQDLAFDIWDAHQRNITVPNWKYDFGKLLTLVGGARNGLKKAVLFGSRPPQNDSLWTAAKQSGFAVTVEDRNAQNQEKKIDTGVVSAMMRDAMLAVQKQKAAETEMILVAGDSDYVPTVKVLIEFGFKVTVCFWDHASRELKDAASAFFSLNPHVNHLGRQQ